MVDNKQNSKGQELIILRIEPSWKKIQELDYRPYFGHIRVLFKALGRMKKKGGGEYNVDQEGTQEPSDRLPIDIRNEEGESQLHYVRIL